MRSEHLIHRDPDGSLAVRHPMLEALRDEDKAIRAKNRLAAKDRRRELASPPKKRKAKKKQPHIDLGLVTITHKLIFAPLESIDAEGEERVDFLRLGVRFDIRPGEWWFYHWKAGSFTHHVQGPPMYYRSGSPIIEHGRIQREPERVTRYQDKRDLAKRMAHCPQLVIALFRELALAEIELEARYG